MKQRRDPRYMLPLPRPRTCLPCVALPLAMPATGHAAEEEAHRVGVTTAYVPTVRQDVLRKCVRDTGAASPRVGMRMDLFQKGMPDHPDAWVIDAASVPGGSALAMRSEERRVGKECRSR